MTPDSPGEPRPAATLVIVRDGDAGLEILLTERPAHMRFMAGASVFPGGAVADADRDPRWEQASVLSAGDAAARSGEPDESLALGSYVCALRESFEEVGFFAGRGPIERLPRRDAANPERFLSDCLALGLVLATDRLVPAGRWVTPVGAPRRFDARFFIVGAPAGWEPQPDPAEVASYRWVTPAAALDDLGRGDVLMAPPTVEMLHRLRDHGTAAEALSGVPNTPPARVLSTALSPLVHVVLAPNPGTMTGPGTNTYVVGAPRGGAVVIDPAVDDDEYIDEIVRAAGRVVSIFVTHRHGDHTGGVAALLERVDAPVRAWGSHPAGGVVVDPVADGDVIEVEGVRLRAVHTPGHASDHMCLLLGGSASLFSGDTILGEGTAVIAPPDGDMRAYLRTLARLRDLEIDRIYPGHFRPLHGGRAVIEGYIQHRRAREQAIVDALSATPTALEEIVAVAYADTPTELHGIAALSARAHLDMLVAEGRAILAEEKWTRSGID